MKLTILAFLFVTIPTIIWGQAKQDSNTFNLSFENLKFGKPLRWNGPGAPKYRTSLDSINSKNGKYSAVIEYIEGTPTFGSWGSIIPGNYPGSKITLTGYIKTENVTEGYAGLWMKIDPEIAFDNMSGRGIQGNSDWTKCEITLTMNPKRTKQILIGGLLVGKGKMWLDDLSIIIDGKDISEIKPIEMKLFQAEKDHEFDDSSMVSISDVDANQIDNIKTLGLVWGFLKYYHPNIARGEFNWDYELFRILPSVLDVKTKTQLDSILIRWVQRLGEVRFTDKPPDKPSNIKLEPDLGWITNSNLSKDLTSLLIGIKNSVRSDTNYYIGTASGAGNPGFTNENAYTAKKYPDAGFRILALFRYWNIIQYYFPNRHLIGENWHGVLKEFIPKLVKAKGETEYTLVILELIGRIHDTHANIWGYNEALKRFLGENYTPPVLTFVENQPVVTGFLNDSLGQLTGLETGDVITKINGTAIEEIVKERLKHTPASNYPTQLRDIAHHLLRTNDSIIHITYSRNGKSRSSLLKSYSVNVMNIYGKYRVKDTCFRMITSDIAYINNGTLKKKYIPEIWEKIKTTKGLIIDIRNYPSDFPIYELSSYLMPKKNLFVRFTRGSLTTPGLFYFSDSLEAGKPNESYYKGKVILLVNEKTQSSAEFHTMAYRTHPNVIVIGSTTAGADGDVSLFYLPGGLRTMISGIGVYYPDGRETQRVGIIPDIEVKPTVEGVRAKRDELMEKALEVINNH